MQSRARATARKAIEDAIFAANRLRTLLSKLQARYRQLRDEEEATAWLVKLDATAERRRYDIHGSLTEPLTPSTWNHRVLMTEQDGEKSYCIHEVYYDETAASLAGQRTRSQSAVTHWKA
jgi:hypothetical protein